MEVNLSRQSLESVELPGVTAIKVEQVAPGNVVIYIFADKDADSDQVLSGYREKVGDFGILKHCFDVVVVKPA